MIVKKITRPWAKRVSHGHRLNPDPFYHTSLWKRTRKAFVNSETFLPGFGWVTNRICIECFKQGLTRKMHTVDHIIRIKDGGDKTNFSNLQSLCLRCHAKKSALEGLALKNKK